MIYQSLTISILFLLCKIIESKISGDKDLPFKDIMKQTFLVLLSSISGLLLFDQLKTYIHSSSLLDLDTKPIIFTDSPGF